MTYPGQLPTDDLDSLNASKSRPTGEQPDKYGDPEDETAAKLLSLEPKKAAALAYSLWKDQPKTAIQRRRAEWQVNAWRREGRTNVFVQKTQDQNRWQAWSPPWNTPPVPLLNKADRLCRRLVAMLFADPPVAQAVPSTGNDEDVEAAEFTERVLTDIQGQGQLDDTRKARRALDRACVYGSGFIRYYLDPHGGGRQPIRLQAKPGAVDADHPFEGPQGEPLEGELVSRYVRQDGTFTDEKAEAATQWMVGIKSELIQPPSVRFLPHDSEDLWDADGVIVATMPTWGELEELWPDEMQAIGADDKAAVLSFKPEQVQDLQGLDLEAKRPEQAKRDQDKRVACFTVYYEACPNYPQGCYFVGLGDRVTLHRQPWMNEKTSENLDIPLTQYTQFEAGRPDPFGLGLMGLLGGGNEIRAAQVGHLLSYLDQFTNRKVFIPTNSILQAKSYQLLQGTAIPINPGGEPKFEDVPDFPTAPLELFTLMSEEMNDQSGMQQTAQGTEVPSVQSGRQASVIVAQAHAGLSDVQQNVERAFLRACRIQLQLIRSGYTVPQRISWTGDDGQYREKWWDGSDLGSTKDVKLKPGTLSMMTPEQKVQLAMQAQQMGAFNSDPDQFYETIVGNLGGTIGLQDDPARQRIKRQLATWADGPGKNWQPPQPPTQMGLDPSTGMPAPQPMMDPATGQPVPPPPDPTLASIFAPLPPDELQDVATIRLAELKRFMASTRYSRWAPEWRLGVDQEFQHMKMAAGVLTIAEQQQAAQQAQQQQAGQADQAATADFERQRVLKGLGPKYYIPHRGPDGKLAALEEVPGEMPKVERDSTGRIAGVQAGGSQYTAQRSADGKLVSLDEAGGQAPNGAHAHSKGA